MIVIVYMLAGIGVVFLVVIWSVLRNSERLAWRDIKMDPVRVDNLPIFECQECKTRWVEDAPPFHSTTCPVALVYEAQRRGQDDQGSDS